MKREEIEAKAMELFPELDYEPEFDYEERIPSIKRSAYIQCYDDLSQTKDLSKTCGYCVKPETKASDNTVSCPICGTECNIMGEGETHYYLPKKEK